MRQEGIIVDVSYDQDNPAMGFGLIYSSVTSKEHKFYHDALPKDILIASVVAGDKVKFTPFESNGQRLASDLSFTERMLVCYQSVTNFVVTENAFHAGAVPLIHKSIAIPNASDNTIEEIQCFAKRCGFNSILNTTTVTDERGTFFRCDLAVLVKPFPLHLASGPYIRYDLMERYIARCQSKFERYKVELGLQS